MSKLLPRIYCNHLELQKRIERLKQREEALSYELNRVQLELKALRKIYQKNEDAGQQWIIPIPVKILQSRHNAFSKANWKRIVYDIISKAGFPMDASLIGSKLIINNESISQDPSIVEKNVRPALHYLSEKDRRLIRVRHNGKYLYGLDEFLDQHKKNFKRDLMNDYATEKGNER